MNWKTLALVPIDEHERDIRDPKVARRLGVPDDVFVLFKRFRVEADRERFLRWLMRTAPLMRIRDHGTHVTFEHYADDDMTALTAITAWAGRFAGPTTLLNLVNLRTRRHRLLLALPFLKARMAYSKRAIRRDSDSRGKQGYLGERKNVQVNGRLIGQVNR